MNAINQVMEKHHRGHNIFTAVRDRIFCCLLHFSRHHPGVSFTFLGVTTKCMWPACTRSSLWNFVAEDR